MTLLQISLATTALGCALVVIYPFVIFPWLLRCGHRRMTYALQRDWITAPVTNRPTRSVAILFCGYNEEAVLREKLENLLQSTAGARVPVKIYVYLDGCTDRSETIATSFGAAVTVVASTQRRGKSVGMRTLVARSSEDVLIFTDANVLFQAELVGTVVDRFDRTPHAGCILGSVRFTNTGESETAHLEGAYWRYEEDLKRLESKIGSCFCGTGAIFAIRRQTYVPTPDDIIDDLHTTMNVLLTGHAVLQAPDVNVFERAATKPRDEWKRKVRVACRSYNCYRLLRPKIARLPWPLRFMFVSHKLVRWYSGALLVAGGVAALLLLLSFSVLAGITVLLVGAVVLLLATCQVWPVAAPWAICQALLASSYGVFLSLRGRRFVTWTPVPSAR